MLRENRSSRESRLKTIDKSFEQSDETEARVATIEQNSEKRGSAQKRWTSSDDSSRDIKTNSEDTETESPDVKSSDRTEEHAQERARSSDVRENKKRIASQLRKKRRKKLSKLKTESRRSGGSYHPRTTDDDRADSRSSAKRHSENSLKLKKSQKRKKNLSRADDDEMPITEILKKTQENALTRYEKPVPLPELTSDRIYIQGRSGFSAVKIGGSRRALRSDTAAHVTEGGITDKKGCCEDLAATQPRVLIKVAITMQNFWKCTGLVYQGLLGGMALLHLVMIHVFFNTSMKFVLDYSVFSEVYTNTFSFLIALCVISVFDKYVLNLEKKITEQDLIRVCYYSKNIYGFRFDLARLDAEHLREIYTDYAKTAITIPLYLITFGLHQATAKTDDRLLLSLYHCGNDTMRSNTWQRITMSKDILAVFAWLFVTLGTGDNMLLTHLESMDNYANNVESPR
ncbi:uncharacterized protein LOC109856881 isoform X2 [Pseudomyrmex gracilis]|uniref:uncharacterized protein LOC109856881 isoform X2 n=1 Tax=Pseudomyrmex gracilis TaxID=219809 RepID=UPI00099528F6|nr:uncharacterized protein LOC109856881 isoform X2 [Pseudomyrmex gracilis]